MSRSETIRARVSSRGGSLALGFELGNHTLDHVRLDELTDEGVQRQIVLGNRLIRDLVPDAKVATIALPYGLLPIRRKLALQRVVGRRELSLRRSVPRGRRAVAVTARPATSSRLEIPRIRSDPRDLPNGSSDWLARLKRAPSCATSPTGSP